MSLKSSGPDRNPQPDTVTQLLQIAADTWRRDPWDERQERALASVIRSAFRVGWSLEDVERVSGLDWRERTRILAHWTEDVA